MNADVDFFSDQWRIVLKEATGEREESRRREVPPCAAANYRGRIVLRGATGEREGSRRKYSVNDHKKGADHAR